MRRPQVLSLYTGAGGLDYGLEAAGFDVAVANDLDHDACETLRRNRPWRVLEDNILDVPTETLLKEGMLEKGELDLLVGGPPCQPFSKSGFWATGDTRRLSDPRAETLAAYLRVVEEVLPRVLLLENVEGLGFSGKSEGLAFLLDAIKRVNALTGARYRPWCGVLNAADFGVPQVRRRLFIVAAREGQSFHPPRGLAHTQNGEVVRRASDGTTFYRSAWDAIGDLPAEPNEDLSLRGKWGRLLASIPEGQNYLWHTNRGGGSPLFGWRRRYWGFLLKLAKARPSWTIQAQPGPAIGPFHWTNRRLSSKELCRLQTFPDDVTVYGSLGSIQRQVGNAVPSLLAEVLGREIRAQLLGDPVEGPLELLPPIRLPVPAPEREETAAAEYLSLIGDHAPHPGTGRGVGALRRESTSARLQLFATAP